MNKKFSLLTFAIVLMACCFARGQGSAATGPPVAVNQSGSPIGSTLVSVCTVNPGAVACPSPAALYTDITLAHPCTGSGALLNNQANPTVGSGCSNPGFTDSLGNVVAFSTSGAYWCQYSGSTIVTYSQPCFFPAASLTSLLSSTNSWSGSNTYNGAVILNGTLNGITVLGTQGGAGNVGYIMFGTGAFTQNTLARFDSSGDVVNSFFTDSGAIGAYTGVNGMFATSYNTNGAGTGFIGWSQGTIPGSCNGGVNTLVADSSSTLFVDCKNISGSTYNPYLVEAGGTGSAQAPNAFFDATGLTSTQTPTLQTAAPAGSQWRVSVNANQVGTCTAVGPGNVVIKVAYTDSGGLQTITVATLTFVSAGVAAAGGSFPFRVNSTNNILLSATYTACTTPNGSTYDIHAWLERVK